MRFLLCLIAFAATSVIANDQVQAQERPGSFYSTAGVTFSHQHGVSGETYQTYVAAPGGTSRGWIVAGGAFIGRGLSLEGEIESTGIMSAREPSRYGQTFNEDRRDVFFGANVRFHGPSGSPVHLEPLIGFTVVRREGWSQRESFKYWLTPQQELVVDARWPHDLPNGVGLTAGLDLRVGSRHLAFVPRFRIRFASVGNDFVSAYPSTGLPKWTVSSGISGRVDF